MIIKEDYDLKNNNTFHISAKTQKLYIPETKKEILELIRNLENSKYYILSGGSNILLNDKKIYENIIYMKNLNNKINHLEDGRFYIGSSNRIQKVIKFINENGYGGIEELYTLPAMFGGIIYMNAGIGMTTKDSCTISNYVESVEVIDKRKKIIKWIKKESCGFSHRKSIFQNDNYIILGAICKFKKQDINISNSIIKNRIDKFNQKADYGNGTFGTIFSISNSKILKFVSIIVKRRNNIRFGKENKNWLVNDSNGKFEDAIYLIKKCKKFHKLFRKKCELEVIIWE